ncbi:MAG: response regulator [Bdellovibrionales bacterium]|nr:response regulator [Oligoflexia bacterium]
MPSISQNFLNPFLYLKQLPSSEMVKKKTKFKKKILIIDDDKEISDLLKSVIEKQDRVEVKLAHDPYEAMSLLSDQVYDMIILDWNLPKLNGLKTIIETEKLFRFDPTLPLEWDSKKVQVVTFSGDETSACRLPNTKHFRYVGHINKKNSLETILGRLNFYFDQMVEPAV